MAGLICFATMWCGFGALVGISIARWKGWSEVEGVVGGAMLGIAAPLMMMVDAGRKCPACAEPIAKEAKVCKHCHMAMPPS